jgi:aminocarboxymuconate-semialdehyde decarboxylase
MLIDVHTHVVPETLPDFAGRAGGERWPHMEPVDPCRSRVVIAGKNFRTLDDRCWSLERRLEDMAREGVTRQVLSPMPKLFSYGFEARDTLDFCRAVNGFIAGLVERAPDRFHGLGQVPLQDPDLAARALAEVKSLGLAGLEIGTNVNGRSLGDPMFLPFFQEAEAQGLPIFIHAHDAFGEARFSGPPVLSNLLGYPQENTLAAATLITGGVIERCPGLRVLFSHGGGGFALALARLDQGWRTLGAFLPRPPSAYVGNFYFDALLYDATALRFLIDRFGPGRVMVGSDYPFDIREAPPGRHLADVPGLSPADLRALRSETCLSFLGMEKTSG